MDVLHIWIVWVNLFISTPLLVARSYLFDSTYILSFEYSGPLFGAYRHSHSQYQATLPTWQQGHSLSGPIESKSGFYKLDGVLKLQYTL